MADGTVWAWGQNGYGQLGRGTSGDPDMTPGQVYLNLPPGVTITDLAAGAEHALALRSDGLVMAWGRNDSGELGNGTRGAVNGIPPNFSATPFKIEGLAEVTAIAAATGNQGNGVYDGGASLALKRDGTVWGWGSNAFGAIDQAIPYQSTRPSDYDPRYPEPVQTQVTGAKAISAYFNNGYALLSDETIRSWESSFSAALGDGTCHECLDCLPNLTFDQPRTVLGSAGALRPVTAIAAGEFFALAVQADGSVWGWGDNSSGQLGDGTYGETVNCNEDFSAVEHLQKTPKQIPSLSGAVGVAAGKSVSLVLKKDGSVWGAGYNVNNQIGVGGDAYVATFQRVPGL